jgi:hypothetical protein
VLAACATPRARAPIAPKLAISHHFRGEQQEPRRSLQPEVVLWVSDVVGTERTEVHGIFGDSLYFNRGWSLFRRHLDSDRVEEISSDSANVTAIATDGGELFWVTGDCQVSSRRRPYLGGKCLANPHYLFVDSEHLYLFARKTPKWRQPVMTLWKMPRSGGNAHEVAELQNFERISGRSEPLVDGDAFYYIDLFGHVFRLGKHATTPTLFGQVPITGHGRLEFVDADAVYWSSDSGLVRAPKDGRTPTVIAQGTGSYANDGGKLYQATEDAIYRALPSGFWERIADLPATGALSSWRLWAVRGKLYAYDYKMMLRIDPSGPRTYRLLDLEPDDVAINSLALYGDDLFYATSDNFEAFHRASEDSPGSALWSLPKGGGTPRLLFDKAHFAAAPVFADGHVHYLGQDGTLYRRSLADLREVKLAARSQLAAKVGTRSQAPNDEPLPAISAKYPALPNLVALDAANVFWLDPALAVLARLPKRGGAAEIVARDLRQVTAMAVDPGYVYLAMRGKKTTLARIAKNGAGVAEVLATSQYEELPFAVADSGVVWVTPSGGDYSLDSGNAFGLMRETGFTPFGRVPNLSNDDGGWHASPICSFALSSDALYFSRCNSVAYRKSVLMRRSFDAKDRIIASGYTAAMLVTPAPDATYFAELGERTIAKGTPIVIDCCSIWVAPR